MADLRVGQVVRLKSGSPPMTIESIGDEFGDVYVRCTWFDGAKPLVHSFKPEQLELDD